MYIPNYASSNDLKLIVNFIRENSFGTLISKGGVHVNHYPFLVTEEREKIILWTHLARNNPQWQDLENHFLVVFLGPHAYVSPTYYVNQLNVPTWNYTAVHAHCLGEVVNDKMLEKDLMERLVSLHEQENQTNWNYQLPDEFHDRLLKGITWLKLEVKSFEGKFKLSQNRDQKDYEKVVRVFSEKGTENHKKLVGYMHLTNPFKN
jgi:transcriptional regulator